MCHTAIDEEFGAGDEAAVVGGEKEDGGGKLIRRADSAQRNKGSNICFELGELLFCWGKIMQAGRIDGAGADDIDANFSRLEVERPTAGKRADGGLACAIDAEGGRARRCGNGSVENNRRAIAKQRKGFLNHKDEALDVCVEGFVEMLLCDRAEGDEFPPADIGEENIESAFLLFDGFKKAVEVFEAGNVTLHGCDIRANILYGGVESGLPTAGDKDESAFGNESLGGCKADAAAAAGDECDFSC